MPLSEMTLADIKAILLPEFIARLKRIYAWATTAIPSSHESASKFFATCATTDPN
jgi:hypothetical protein